MGAAQVVRAAVCTFRVLCLNLHFQDTNAQLLLHTKLIILEDGEVVQVFALPLDPAIPVLEGVQGAGFECWCLQAFPSSSSSEKIVKLTFKTSLKQQTSLHLLSHAEQPLLFTLHYTTPHYSKMHPSHNTTLYYNTVQVRHSIPIHWTSLCLNFHKIRLVISILQIFFNAHWLVVGLRHFTIYTLIASPTHISYHTIPYHTIPYHTIPCHTIPYLTPHTLHHIHYTSPHTLTKNTIISHSL